jgi:hypothetical protein
MSRVMRTGCLGLVLASTRASPGIAQYGEEVKPVFEHEIPIEGKRMVALVVSYAPGGKSPAHRDARSAFICAHVLSGALRSQVDEEPVNVYQGRRKASTRCPARITGSVRMQVTGILRACWLVLRRGFQRHSADYTGQEVKITITGVTIA